MTTARSCTIAPRSSISEPGGDLRSARGDSVLLISSGARAETSPSPAPTVAPVVESPATPAVGVSADAPPNTNGDFRPQFACYGELGGAAVVYSANLELRPAEPFSVRLGAAVLPVSTTGLLPITVVGASTYLGRAPHHFEIGLNYAHAWLAACGESLPSSAGRGESICVVDSPLK